jgi:acetolactate synthase-1/3 small subunit
MQHTISVLVKNEAGVLSRMTNLFSARGYNIESLTVATTLDTKYARATIVVTNCDGKVIEQILKQLNKLIPVIKVYDLTPDNSTTLELVFIKLEATKDRNELLKIVETFGAKIIEFTSKSCTLQIVCNEKQLKSFVEMLKPIGIKDIVRSGAVSL